MYIVADLECTQISFVVSVRLLTFVSILSLSLPVMYGDLQT